MDGTYNMISCCYISRKKFFTIRTLHLRFWSCILFKWGSRMFFPFVSIQTSLFGVDFWTLWTDVFFRILKSGWNRTVVGKVMFQKRPFSFVIHTSITAVTNIFGWYSTVSMFQLDVMFQIRTPQKHLWTIFAVEFLYVFKSRGVIPVNVL